MPGNAPPLIDERQLLLAYIAQQRDGLRNTAYGLTDEQARLTPTAGTLSIGGLIKHVAATEEYWIGLAIDRQPDGDDAAQQSAYENGFTLLPDETLAGVLATYDAVAQETEAVVAKLDLEQPVPVPRDAPWFPDDVDAWSVRWVLLHVIEETARHAGHADIVRESIDGATMFPLMAAAEGWPATPWMTPWEPAS
jgi:uncharacterized damage-inducible protein DinB